MKSSSGPSYICEQLGVLLIKGKLRAHNWVSDERAIRRLNLTFLVPPTCADVYGMERKSEKWSGAG